MSLYKAIQRPKSSYNIIEKINNAKVYTQEEDEFERLNSICLDINSVFKMVKIELEKPVPILKTIYGGMAIQRSGNIIYIRNNFKVNLKENVLIQYLGDVVNINSVRVYGWGQRAMLASITKNENESKEINNQEDVFNTSSFKIDSHNENYQTPKRMKNPDISKYSLNDTVFGFYTNGYKFKIGRKRYIGHYHYHPATDTYMTGFDHHSRSVVLKKIIRRRRP